MPKFQNNTKKSTGKKQKHNHNKNSPFQSEIKKSNSSNNQNPLFSFIHVTKTKKYNFEKAQKDQKALLLNHLLKLGQLTWLEIMKSDRHGAGSEKIAQDAIRNVFLPSCITPDKKLIVFRCGQKIAMVGFREDNIFHLIFVDWDFSAYNHGS